MEPSNVRTKNECRRCPVRAAAAAAAAHPRGREDRADRLSQQRSADTLSDAPRFPARVRAVSLAATLPTRQEAADISKH